MKCEAGRQEKQLTKMKLPHGLTAGANKGRRVEKKRKKIGGCKEVEKKAQLGLNQSGDTEEHRQG